MLKIINEKEIWRGGDKVGWVREKQIFDEHGTKLGYYDGDDVYDRNTRKIAGIDDSQHLVTRDGKRYRLDDVHDRVSGGTISDLERAAIWLLIGD